MGIVERARVLRVTIEELATAMSDEAVLETTELLPVWKSGVEYSAGARVRYHGTAYKCLQGHTSQDDWTPANAPSLFAEILRAAENPGHENEAPEWKQPDSTNPYMKGDRVTHNGIVWESLVDSNVWEPSADLPALWKIVNG